MERALERLIFASRWLMVPFFVGLIAALLMLVVKFGQELWRAMPTVLTTSDTDVLLVVLSLLDLTLAGGLVLMVMLSGYESFVSRMGGIDAADRPSWLGTLDFGGLKLKLIASLVAISGIYLLKSFMNVASIGKPDLMWQVIIHLTFVLSGVLLALMDWLSEKGKVLEKG